uniref:Uncharacterized protein n=1 Tax=Octopus bimaculoides TaxID=37653 RepID=A0A0L8IEG8_OCTBM
MRDKMRNKEECNRITKLSIFEVTNLCLVRGRYGCVKTCHKKNLPQDHPCLLFKHRLPNTV